MDTASEDVESLRAANRLLLLLVTGFCKKERTGNENRSCGGVLKTTNCERVEAAMRKRQLWFAGGLVQQLRMYRSTL